MTLRFLLIIVSFLAMNHYAAAGCGGPEEDVCPSGYHYTSEGCMHCSSSSFR